MKMKRNKNPEEKAAAKESRRQSFQSQQFRRGGYSIALSALALAIVIAVNLLVGKLPAPGPRSIFLHRDLHPFGGNQGSGQEPPGARHLLSARADRPGGFHHRTAAGPL